MDKNEMLQRAISIAAEAHKNQFDKYGAPYFGHVSRVMNNGNTLDEKIVGVLHDVVEDTHWTFEQLAGEGFPAYIIEAIRSVTKTSDEEDYDAFVQRTSKNPLGIKVKLNDLLDNMDVRRMPVVTAKDAERLNKYLKAYRFLVTL
jgi:(p)ppGpp synthase/HD superfamily hydrolase